KPVKYHWDEMKIGPGAPPIKTAKGWLNIYHGVFPTMDGSVYRLGVALHNLDDPATIIAVSDRWILSPQEQYELVGYVHNVVFTCAAVPEEDGTLKLYWGAADTVMCAGTAVIDELVDFCLSNPRAAM
ncbi:MAG: glycosidase, partial [Phycisphaerae bacterium]